MKRFHSTLLMVTKDNKSVNGFLPLSKNYVAILEKNPYNFEFPDNPLNDEDDSSSIIWIDLGQIHKSQGKKILLFPYTLF